MEKFTYHTRETAPEASKALLGNGFIPNLSAIMAESPQLLESYKTLWRLLSESSFTPLEQQIIMMTANFENNCHYCVPWHTLLMVKADMPHEIIDALRNGTPIPDQKLEKLRAFTREMIDKRGHVGDDRIEELLEAGYTRRHVLDVVVGLAVKTLSNYTNALTHTDLDAPPKAYDWVKPE